jgi:hypothetical protein
VAASLLAAAPAAAQSPPQPFAPYDGAIPFNCELQNVGTGTAFPHPEADPFCVEFDKTNQNVSDFGIADFTAQEPARVAAASSKCFYFQRDHWTGSVVQGSGPETWHWDGDYWYDRARGVGGVSVRNFRIGGQAQDPSPYAPEAYRPYFGEGGGGAMVNMATAPSPDCIDKVDTPEERDRVYAGRGLYPDCIDPGGRLHGKHVGEVKLGMSRDKARQKLGPPGDHAHGIDYWCLIGKGELRVAYVEGKAAAVLTSGRGHSVHGVSRGDHAQRAHRRLHLIDGRRAAGYHLFTIGGSLDPLDTIALEAGRVRWVMIADIKPLVGHALPKQLIRDVP